MVRVESINKIADVFLDNLEKRFTIRALSKEAGLSYDTTYRHVEYLLEKQVLTEKAAGKARLCGLNLGNKNAEKLIEGAGLRKTTRFFKKNRDIETLLKEITKRAEDEIPNQLLSVVLYGTKGPDVDLLFLVSSIKVKKTIEDICKEMGLKNGRGVRSVTASISDFEKTLESREQADHQEVVYGTVLYGYEDYYSLLFRSLH